MHWLARLGLIICGNVVALWLANRYVAGFVLNEPYWLNLLLIGLILALLNFLLKPILTLMLGPVIVLTLGLGLIIVNAFILWLLPVVLDRIDFLRGSIMIQTIPALFWATLIVGAINLLIHLAE
jgi:putative membrane protein